MQFRSLRKKNPKKADCLFRECYTAVWRSPLFANSQPTDRSLFCVVADSVLLYTLSAPAGGIPLAAGRPAGEHIRSEPRKALDGTIASIAVEDNGFNVQHASELFGAA